MQISIFPSASLHAENQGLSTASKYHAAQVTSCNEFLSKIFDDIFNGLNPIAFSTSIICNNVCNLSQMKYQPDRGLFEEAMTKEMNSLMDNDTMEVSPR